MLLLCCRSCCRHHCRCRCCRHHCCHRSLQDSPLGTAAWILEKLRGWSDCDGQPDNAFSKDEMLTNICIYIYGGRIASSIRLYKETFGSK